jgi:hypothetical protein
MKPDNFYTTPGPLSSAGTHTKLLDGLPRELPTLVKAIQGVVIHE